MVNDILWAMIRKAQPKMKDVHHLMKVHSYARMIGIKENLDEDTLETLEIAAIVHDIACPLCREKYGHTHGKEQEIEGDPLAREFLAPFGLPQEKVDRVAYLVGHHHTYNPIQGIDYQILIEADYIVNAFEQNINSEAIQQFRDTIFKTDSGKELLTTLYLQEE